MEYSSSYVNTSKDCQLYRSACKLVSRCNGYINQLLVSFNPLECQFSIDYLLIEYYKNTIDGSALRDRFSFSANHLFVTDENWKDSLSFDYDFEDEA